MKVNRNSMLLWYPQIKDLPIPQPQTLILRIPFDVLLGWIEGPIPKDHQELITGFAERLGYPVFIRTDVSSGKHLWKDTCFVENKGRLFANIQRLIEDNQCASLSGLFCNALVFRKFIDMDSRFTAFQGLPICPERRYFINNGEITDHFPYWPEQAIIDPSISEWKQELAKANAETADEIELLSGYAKSVSEVMEGEWSVDFCRGRDGKWWMIDLACAEDSWRPDKKKGVKMDLNGFQRYMDEIEAKIWNKKGDAVSAIASKVDSLLDEEMKTLFPGEDDMASRKIFRLTTLGILIQRIFEEIPVEIRNLIIERFIEVLRKNHSSTSQK
jgi:hypothetical protein